MLIEASTKQSKKKKSRDIEFIAVTSPLFVSIS